MEGAAHHGGARVGVVQEFPVVNQVTQGRGQIRGGPFAGHIRFAQADVAVAGQPPEKLVIPHMGARGDAWLLSAQGAGGAVGQGQVEPAAL